MPKQDVLCLHNICEKKTFELKNGDIWISSSVIELKSAVIAIVSARLCINCPFESKLTENPILFLFHITTSYAFENVA